MTQTEQSLTLLALVGAGEPEIPVLAELHRNPRVHVVGIYDPDEAAVGHELAEILGIRHGSSSELMDQIAAADRVILPRDRHRFAPIIQELQDRGARFLNPEEAMTLFASDRVVTRRVAPVPEEADVPLTRLEEAVTWLDKALDREEVLRGFLSVGLQAVGGDHGSIQLLDEFSGELYIAYAEGLSDHTVRSAQQKLGEGIAGQVALTRNAQLIQGGPRSQDLRDRPDIQSAVCVPLIDGERVLGVLSISTNLGSKRLTQEDLSTVLLISHRMSRVLARVLHLQALHEQALVEDLERELDRLLLLDGELTDSLGLLRDLLVDASGAEKMTLIILTPDGPAFRILADSDEDGNTRSARDVDAGSGILGQVLLSRGPVVMEERTREAGARVSRRRSVLYVPLGEPESFAVMIVELEGLSKLSQFQRSLPRLSSVLTPRLAALLSRDATRRSTLRLRQLAEGLTSLPSMNNGERWGRVAELFAAISGASGVALWENPEEDPHPIAVWNLQSVPMPGEALWGRLAERLARGQGQRLRELDPKGSDLRSLLLVRHGSSRAMAAINRVGASPVGELGFRTEDLDSAELLLQAMAPRTAPPNNAATTPPRPPSEDAEVTPIDLLREALTREVVRSQRYHLAFSLTAFRMGLPEDVWGRVGGDLRTFLQGHTRETDLVVWLSERQFVVLAPEEARGQKQLVRRLRDALETRLHTVAPNVPATLDVQRANYPQDADSVEGLLKACHLT